MRATKAMGRVGLSSHVVPPGCYAAAAFGEYHQVIEQEERANKVVLTCASKTDVRTAPAAMTRSPRRFHLLGDSGAYTNWRRERPSKFREWFAWARDFVSMALPLVATIAMIGLDVIPGHPQQPLTRAHIEDAAQESYANWAEANVLGLETLPTFHQGEDFKYLHQYLDAGVTYLCLSDRGSKVVSGLKECWRHLPSGTRVHLLGATDKDVLSAVPAYSGDSSTWMQMGKNGPPKGAVCGSLGTLTWRCKAKPR
ncbi:MAG TPA: hypothetical protein VEV39_03210 [Gemmatimonadales bacterium]|nr:hypothetical protein [Gemmatimonadales bacterium]